MEGRAVLLAGGTGGIGRAIALRLAREGWTVHASYHSRESEAEELTRQSAEMPGTIITTQVDVTDDSAIDRWIERCVEESHLEAIVTSIGWQGAWTLFGDQDPSHWPDMVAINFMGPIKICKSALPHLIDREYGRIVFVGSDSGKVGESGAAVLGGTLGGINAFAKGLARELARHGITVNSVCPGPVDTPILRDLEQSSDFGAKIVPALRKAIPMKRVARPDEIASVVNFLVTEDASFVTGQALSVSGGLTMC